MSRGSTMLIALLRDAVPPGGGPLHVGKRLRLLAVASLVLLLFAMLCAAAFILRRDTQSAFGVGAALAMLPVPAYLSVIIWADRYEPEPPGVLAAAFLWGAGAALVLAYIANSAGHEVVATEFGPDLAEVYLSSISAPIVEEVLKAIPLLAIAVLMREQIDDLVDGVVYAGAVGLGFAMSENILYYGREAGSGTLSDALELFVLRGVWNPFIHPLFTMATGLAIAVACRGRVRVRWRVVLLGLGAAILLHSTWNTTVGTAWHDVMYAGLFLPLLAAVGIAVALTRRRELEILRMYLPRGLGVELPADCLREAPLATSRVRRGLRTAARKRGGRAGAHAFAAYEQAATELAFLQRRLESAAALPNAEHVQARETLRRRVVDRFRELQALGVVPPTGALVFLDRSQPDH